MRPVSLRQHAEDLAARRVSSVELTEWTIARIRRLEPALNAFISLCEESALEEARAADTAIARGEGGRLTGIPLAHKDIFCTRATTTTCGSRMLANWVAPYDATVVEHLRGAGMVTVGKTNMDEFAMGSSNETSHFGPVRNPWDPNRVPGGSSGGSAAAVAAGLVSAATGTDTGGSIRQPAAMCGVTGIKPTYGRVSRYGMVAFASSLDQAGVLARSAEDCAMVLQAMAGHDPRDSTSAEHPVDDYANALHGDIRGLRVGIVETHFGEGLDPGVAGVIEEVLRTLRALGAQIVSVDMPHAHLAIPAYYVIAPAECSSNLSRFDGVRFGHRAADVHDLQEMYRRTRSEGFGTEVKRRIMLGTYALSTGYYDAYYLRAQRVRRLVAEDFRRAFASVDVLLGPTSPTVAFGLAEKLDDPVTMYYSDIYTIGANLAGLPAMSLPAGFSDALPVGFQLTANHFEEARLLRAAYAYQQATDWHLRVPAGFD